MSLERDLFSVEEVDHYVDICTVVTSGQINLESPVIINTIGVSAFGKNMATYIHYLHRLLIVNLCPTFQLQKTTLVLVK